MNKKKIKQVIETNFKMNQMLELAVVDFKAATINIQECKGKWLQQVKSWNVSAFQRIQKL